MKRFWLVLLSLGLVMAFSASVFAADVKFTGSYYAAGMYQDNTLINEDGVVATNTAGTPTVTAYKNASTAFYYQRLRVQMDFIATPYLKLVTRFDAMERAWGNARSGATSAANLPTNNMRWDFDSYGQRSENENIAFDWAYIWYASKIGIWQVGIQEDGAWGTVFANNARPEGKVAWMLVKMPFIAGLQIVKLAENDSSAINGYTGAEDADIDKYQGYVMYNFKGNNVAGQVGILGVFQHYQEGGFIAPMVGTASDSIRGELFILQPFTKLKVGPVAIEAEVDYMFGKFKWRDGVATDDIKVSNLEAYIDALADFGMFYVGGTLAFMDGDKQATKTKIEGGLLSGGRDWNPALLMFNSERYYWANNILGNVAFGNISMGAPMNNAYFAQLRGGVRPVSDLDIMASVSWAKAVRTPAVNTLLYTANPAGVSFDNGNNEEYGWEVDVTATYKITNNLSYMLGGGYWFVGDFYKGTNKAYDVDDNFIILNKLTLTF